MCIKRVEIEFQFRHFSKFLIVQDQPPLARIEPHYITARMGEAVQLRCIASGHPTPRIEWSGGPDDVLPVDSIIENDILRFQSVASRHAGEYQCSAVNQAGKSITHAVLEVQEGMSTFVLTCAKCFVRSKITDG